MMLVRARVLDPVRDVAQGVGLAEYRSVWRDTVTGLASAKYLDDVNEIAFCGDEGSVVDASGCACFVPDTRVLSGSGVLTDLQPA